MGHETLVGFPPISHSSARVLVLGSMPGEKSLQAGEYYAHPRNGFWKILERLVGLDCRWPYEQRRDALKRAEIAVWDVLKSCRRDGSLDTAIEADSMTANPFREFFRQHPRIDLVCFNGTAACRIFGKKVLPTLSDRPLRYCCLPSTSPAHTMPLEDKIELWRAGLFEDVQAGTMAKARSFGS